MPKEERPYWRYSSGKCPHCREIVTFSSPTVPSGHSSELMTVGGGDNVYVYSSECPNRKCRKPIVIARIESEGKTYFRLVHPFNVVRTVPTEVPKDIQKDFLEAAAVLSVSEKASAALSRRCLQNLLNERGYTGRTLSDQIDAVLLKLPTDLADNVDAIRNIGNFAAHPMKSQSTGIVIDVEPGESGWNLDVLEGLFDHFYVRPAREKEKRERLAKKLRDLGKPPLKKP